MQKISNLFKSEIFFFSFIFLIFFALQAKSLTTGDGGELIGATFGLGVAHPSGYPLYLLLGKLFTFLPLGNIPLKVVLVSSLSSAIILTLIFSYLKNHYSFYTGLFATLLLLSSYSFVGQSLIAKFYPLNTLLILIIFYLGLKNLEEYEVKDQLIISFLLGIALSLHHTTFLMFIPLIIPFISNFKNAIKNMFFSILFFLLGSSSTLYILIRSQKPTLINLSPSLNFSGLIYTLLRKAYNKGASTEVAKKLIYLDLDKILSTIKNMFLLLKSQFHIYSFIFFILGILFIVSNKNPEKRRLSYSFLYCL
ncbi:protein O-mannosyl-transferase family [Desulfonauticus submarinus]